MYESDEEGGFVVNCAEVVKSKECLAVTRLLAADLLARPYMLIGDWFKGLSDSDLQMLISGCEPEEETGEDMKLEDPLLITLMLMQAEGLPPLNDPEQCRTVLSQFISFLAIESLARKGLVRVFRENMSFGTDSGNKIVVEKL